MGEVGVVLTSKCTSNSRHNPVRFVPDLFVLLVGLWAIVFVVDFVSTRTFPLCFYPAPEDRFELADGIGRP